MCGYCGCFRMVLKGPTNLHSTSVIHRWADFRSQTLTVIPPVVALTPFLCRTRLSCQYLGFLKKKCNSEALCRSLPPHSWNVSGNLRVPLAQNQFFKLRCSWDCSQVSWDSCRGWNLGEESWINTFSWLPREAWTGGWAVCMCKSHL